MAVCTVSMVRGAQSSGPQPTPADSIEIERLCDLADRLYFVDPKIALASAQKASQLAGKLGYTRGVIRASLGLGTLALANGNYDEANKQFNTALELSSQQGRKEFQAEALHRLGNFYFRKGDYAGALSKYQQALRLREETRDTVGADHTLNNIAELLYEQKQYEQSLAYLEKIVARRVARRDSANLEMQYCNIAKNQAALGRYADALTNLNLAKLMARNAGNKVIEWDAYYNLGDLYKRRLQWEQALEEFSQAYGIAQERGNDFMIAPTVNRLAEAYLATGQSQKAVAISAQSEAMAVRLGSLPLLLDTYQTLGKVQEATRGFERALHFIRKAHVLEDSVKSLSRNRLFNELQVQYETKQKEEQIQLLKKNEDLQRVYQTLLIIGYLLITITLILVFLRYRAHLQSEKQLKNKNDEVQLANAEVTRQMRLLDEQAKELKKVGKEKDEFIGIAAHDLKNPIAAIRIFTGLLRHSADRLSQKEIWEYTSKIQLSADQMMEIVMNLLESNRLESGNVALSLTPGDVGPLLDQLAATYKERAAQKHINFKVDYEDPLPVVLMDNMSMLQVLDNLVSNAVKFSPRGTTVTLRAIATDDSLHIEVRDQGPGILPKDFPLLFNKFARLSARPTGGESSTGLGLSIVKKLVELMGGTVSCESEPGKGANFIVTLPLPPLEEELDEEDYMSNGHPAGVVKNPLSMPARKP